MTETKHGTQHGRVHVMTGKDSVIVRIGGPPAWHMSALLTPDEAERHARAVMSSVDLIRSGGAVESDPEFSHNLLDPRGGTDQDPARDPAPRGTGVKLKKGAGKIKMKRRK